MNYTRGDIKEQARVLVNSLGTEWVTDDQINVLADQANEQVYREIINHCPDMVTTTTAFTFPSSVGQVVLSGASYLNAVPMRVKSVEDTQTAGAYSASNRTRAWERSTYEEVTRIRLSYATNVNPWPSGALPKIVYCVDDVTLEIVPATTIPLNVRMRWIAYLAKMTGNNDPVLNGKAQQFGQAVGYALAELINVRQGGINQAVTAKWLDARDNIAKTSSERVRGPQIVHNSRINPWR